MGTAAATDRLVPKWSNSKLTVAVTIPRKPEPGKAVHAAMLAPEPA